MNYQEYALILAGGKGTRLKSPIPKQFVELCGKPILLHTVEAFLRYSHQIQIVLVLPEEDIPIWHFIEEKFNLRNKIVLQNGGNTRFQSVRNGLQLLEGEGLVAIHDGVRPLITSEIIAASFQLAATQQSAVAAVELKESIRMIDQNHTQAINRAAFKIVQTPQTFYLPLIKQAYQVEEDVNCTDDASVAEKAGYTISLFEGSYENIKITTPEDLIVAEALMKTRKR